MKPYRSLPIALSIILLSGLAAPVSAARSQSVFATSTVPSTHAFLRALHPGAQPTQHLSAKKSVRVNKVVGAANRPVVFPAPSTRSLPPATLGKTRPVSGKSFQPASPSSVSSSPAYQAHFAAESGSGSLVTFTSGQAKIAFTLLGAQKVSANLTMSGVVYNRILPGVDLSYQRDPGGLKENIVLHRANAPTSFSFLVNTAHVFVRDDTTKGLVFYDSQTRRPVAMIPNPVVTDAAGVMSRTAATLQAVPDHTGQLTVTVHVDPQWLAAKGRAFPVTIDPSIVDVTGPALPAAVNSLGRVDYGSLSIPVPSASAGPQEVLALRTHRSQTFVNPNGTFTTKLFPTQQFYGTRQALGRPSTTRSKPASIPLLRIRIRPMPFKPSLRPRLRAAVWWIGARAAIRSSLA